MKLFSSRVRENADAARVTDYTRLYKCGAVVCYAGLFVQIPNFLTVLMSEYSVGRLVFFLFYLSGIPVGYAVQALAGRLFSISRTSLGEYTYEDTRRYYRFFEAFLCHIAAVLALIAVNAFLGKHWELYRSYEDYHSVIPLFVGLGTAFMVEMGGYLWFFPYNALISMRRIGPLGVLVLIDFLVSVMNAGSGIPHAGFDILNLSMLYLSVALFMLILNQSFITRSFGASQLFGVNDNAKRYSVRVVGVFLVIVFGAPFLLVLALKLAFSLLKMLGRASIAVMIGRQPQAAKTEQVIVDSAEGTLERLPQHTVPGGWLILFIVLGLALVGLIVFLYIPTFREKFRTFLELLRRLWRFLCTSHSDWRRRRRFRGENINYVDTEERTRKRSAAFFGKQESAPTYRDFEKKLDALPSLSEKVCYAYAVAAHLLEHQNCQITRSDTPREIAGKVRKRSLVPGIESMTDVFEQLHYREASPDEQNAPRTLEELKAVVKLYLV